LWGRESREIILWGATIFSGYFIVTLVLCINPIRKKSRICTLDCKISFPTSIIAVAVASAVSPLAAGLLALCYWIRCRVEWFRLRIWIGNGAGHGLGFRLRLGHEAVAPVIDPGAVRTLLAFLLFGVIQASAEALTVYPVA
jgi:hypothetical protein